LVEADRKGRTQRIRLLIPSIPSSGALKLADATTQFNWVLKLLLEDIAIIHRNKGKTETSSSSFGGPRMAAASSSQKHRISGAPQSPESSLPFTESSTETTEEYFEDPIDIVNTLLRRIKVPLQITTLRECVPSLFIALFEGLLEMRIPGIERGNKAMTEEGRIHNMNVLLQILEEDVLGIEIEHIIPEEVVSGDKLALSHLIEIFGSIGKALDSPKDKMQYKMGHNRGVKARERDAENQYTQDSTSSQSANHEVRVVFLRDNTYP
jgi:hypothetical protein